MEELRVCRICLITDVRMYDLRSYPLSVYYEPIPGADPLSEVNLPTYVCYECAALIKKFYLFREKCLRGQGTLYTLLKFNKKLTTDDIRNIDRQSFRLSTNFAVHKVTEESIQCYNHEGFDVKVNSHEGVEKTEVDSIFGKANIEADDDDDDFAVLSSNNEDEEDRKDISLVKVPKIEKLEESSGEVKKKSPSIVSTKKPSSASVTKARKKSNNESGVQRSRKKEDDDAKLLRYVMVVTLSLEEQKEEILKRQESANYRNSPFKCNLCYKGFVEPVAFNHHVEKHDVKAGPMECPVCKLRFRNKICYDKHIAIHRKKYACKSCSFISTNRNQAKLHQEWHDGVTYECQHCGEISSKWTSHLGHVRIKHPSQFICGVCGNSFVSKLGLMVHKTKMHKDIAEKADEAQDTGQYCEQCDVKFLTEEAWKRHMVICSTHKKQNMSGCPVCGEWFPSADKLREHRRSAHPRKQPSYGKRSKTTWPKACPHCPEMIPNAREYHFHFRRAHKDKPYPIEKNHICDICGKRFRHKWFLEEHRRAHAGLREHACGACGKAFRNRTHLAAHARAHSDARPFLCAVCEKAFKSKAALQRHFRSHTGERPFKCEVCGKAFGHSDTLSLHVRTVHNKEPAPYVSRSRREKQQKALAKRLAQAST